MSKHGLGYPRYEEDRIVRVPYEERALRDLHVANDPDAQPRPDSPEFRRQFREERRAREPNPNPIVTATPPPRQRLGPMAPPPIPQLPHFYSQTTEYPNRTIRGFNTMFSLPAQNFKRPAYDAVDNPSSSAAINQTRQIDMRWVSRNPAASSADAEDRESGNAHSMEETSRSVSKHAEDERSWSRGHTKRREGERRK